MDLFQPIKAAQSDKRLFCFPYLGGHANVFSKLFENFNYPVEVWATTLPGHPGSKGRLLENITDVVEWYMQALKKITEGPLIFFGHSMGGVIAYFLAQRLLASTEFLFKPAALILSACGTPCSFKAKNYSSLSDKDLIKHLTTYESLSPEIMEERSLMDYFIPIFRSDFKVLESASEFDFEPLDIPVYFLWGERDKIVPVDAIADWSPYFLNEINLLPVTGGSHLFIRDQPECVLEKIEFIMKLLEEN